MELRGGMDPSARASAMISLHRSMHSMQIAAPGMPELAINISTCSCALPQKLHFRLLLSTGDFRSSPSGIKPAYRRPPTTAYAERPAHWTGTGARRQTVTRRTPPYRTASLRTTGTCPRDVPEPPSTANDRHQQEPVNLKLIRAFSPRPTHQNILVMRSRAVGDEDQGAELPTVVRDRRRRARCVPDRPVNGGNFRSFADNPIHRLTCEQAG